MRRRRPRATPRRSRRPAATCGSGTRRPRANPRPRSRRGGGPRATCPGSARRPKAATPGGWCGQSTGTCTRCHRRSSPPTGGRGRRGACGWDAWASAHASTEPNMS